MNLRILIVDDSEPFLESARRLLKRDGLEVVGSASTSPEAVAQAKALHPDVALVDVNLAGESGFEVARQLAQHAQDTPLSVILMSTHSATEYAELIEESPAVGFVAKERLASDVIRRALRGGS